MKRRAIVTVATRNYAHYAFALAESVNQHHPEADFYICFADTPTFTSPPSSVKAQQFLAADLGIDNWPRFAFQYTPFELSCALKPFAMRYLCEQGYDEIVYLDADMRIFNPLESVFEALSVDSIVLTPHLIRPFPDDGGRPGEDLFLMAGTFNAGFLAIRRDDVSAMFLSWWMRRLKTDCFVDLSASIFVDQKWLSLVPGLFDRVHILRDPTYNTGHWTLPQFSLSLNKEGRACIDQRPIALFHFSNLSPTTPLEFDHCQNRTRFSEQPVLKALVAEYHAALRRYDTADFGKQGSEYDRLKDGTQIRPEWREAIRRKDPLFEMFNDPFNPPSVSGLIAKFISIEPGARKWRKDWRLKGVANPRVEKKRKKLEKQIKSVLYAIGLRKKAA